MMQKVQLPKGRSAESLVVVHTVSDSGMNNASQWAQIDVTGGIIDDGPSNNRLHATRRLTRME